MYLKKKKNLYKYTYYRYVSKYVIWEWRIKYLRNKLNDKVDKPITGIATIFPFLLAYRGEKYINVFCSYIYIRDIILKSITI